MLRRALGPLTTRTLLAAPCVRLLCLSGCDLTLV